MSTDKTTAQEKSSSRKRMQMADIARMAGVSTSTVSRALNGSPLIPEATRARIAELARSLNYTVNVGAANLRKRDVQTVALVHLGDTMQRISDPFLLSMVGHVADGLESRGMNLLLTRLNGDRIDQIPAMVQGGQVAGLIVIGQLGWHDYLNELASQGLPLVVWGAVLPDAMYRAVGSDNILGGYLATRHLIEQGCQSIAFVGDTHHPEGRLRHQGYAKAISEAGHAVDPLLFHPFLFGEEGTREAVARWIDSGHVFDGVFAASDIAAVNVISALSSRGLDVPGQVKVVGYDDIPMASYVHPSLTTIRQPTDVAGQALVELLFEALQGQPRRSVVLSTELVVRESSAL
ncbi:MAG: HTH-type transcriptional repressor CytR [Pseudomonadota bacterium]|jgi:DNA-binding LacI/PurR family transcriptional regulator